MSFRNYIEGYNPNYFLPATAALFLACVISVLHINLPGGAISFQLLPLLIISLWPRGINSILTIITFFLMGLFMDWGSQGALGQWAVIYLSLFAIMRPDRRDRPLSVFFSIKAWLMGVLIGGCALIVTGWFAYGIGPNFIVLFQQALLVTILIPAILFLRYILVYLMTDPSDRDFL